LIAAAVIALYLWTTYGTAPGQEIRLLVGLPAVIMASVVAIISLTTYIRVPQKSAFAVDLIIYLLLIATSAALIVTTGNASSPFIATWLLVSVFAGVFGLWGTLPILIATSTFTAIQFINANFKTEVIVAIVFSGLLPMIAGLIIWRSKSDKDESGSDARAYKNLASELNEVASKSEVVINAIGDGVIAIDNQGVIQLINPAAQQIIGWGKQDALALNYKSVLQLVNQKDEALDAASDPIQQSLNINQQIRTNNLTLMTNSGKKLMISLVVSPVGEVGSGVIVVFHDATKEVAEEREQAEFISTASHEMRTPVASIEGYLGLAINPQTATVDSRAQDYILKAHASAQHLGRLFQDLLDVSKADDGRISNNPKVVDIVTFLHEIVQGLEQKATEKGLKLTYKPMPSDTKERHITPVYSVNLDNDHIREVANNLIENAIKYTPMGEVVVDVNGDDDHVVISVKDSGIGIPVEDMPHLFQKFYRVDNINTREIGGTGLGLYLSRRLAEIMGGRIWADSAYGSGSTFYVELPRISSQEANQLIEQEAFKAQQEANQIAASQPEPNPAMQDKVFVQSQPAPDVPARPVAIPSQSAAPAQIYTQPPVQQVPNHTPTVIESPRVIPSAPTTTQSQPTEQPNAAVKPATSVPRGQALTPEQIAAYVAQQRALAQQQAAQQPTPQQSNIRPQTLSIPVREPR